VLQLEVNAKEAAQEAAKAAAAVRSKIAIQRCTFKDTHPHSDQCPLLGSLHPRRGQCATPTRTNVPIH